LPLVELLSVAIIYSAADNLEIVGDYKSKPEKLKCVILSIGSNTNGLIATITWFTCIYIFIENV